MQTPESHKKHLGIELRCLMSGFGSTFYFGDAVRDPHGLLRRPQDDMVVLPYAQDDIGAGEAAIRVRCRKADERGA
jgi:hypothetical protein